MKDSGISEAVFVTVVRGVKAEAEVRLLAESIRAFAGRMSNRPFWVYTQAPERLEKSRFGKPGVEVIPLGIPEGISKYIFADTASACALAEERAKDKYQSLIWIDTSCLAIGPPLMLDLGQDADAALRPVHIRNVGSPADKPPNGYWQGVFNTVGVRDVSLTVTSFVDGELIRSYFNTHAFSVNPDKGLMARWAELFQSLVTDKRFQTEHCSDDVHKIFLFQALLSTLLVTSLEAERIRILPPDYSYPYNLHDKVPEERRVKALDELTTFTYEGRSIHPGKVTDIEIGKSLRDWLGKRLNVETS
ncbi:hypothetical protein GF359_09900 [candidate division WOR-3 bacterium]|uniref:Uncharacterized protein n=1 Tax=candidate division WOR-3 bacterium TaxID=2052148 RepID=A0A9D5KAW8_UNCW3|nr:hypothetical protein [candidate division WOR-3 bacterium]MBD3365513.1 hypothetical protein [candidate division WOR-3 bacterium]